MRFKIGHFDDAQRKLITEADTFAARAHKGQLRRSGDPFINHPREVAKILLGWRMDASTVTAALLHDTVEDTAATANEIEANFGAEVAQLVDGVTNLGQVDFVPTKQTSARQEASNENIRKLLLAMSKDLRVITIKLADRLHNMRTLKHLSPADQIRVAQETLQIYAPLADRLGMGELKAELEDLSFAHAMPQEWEGVKRQVAKEMAQARRYITRIKRHIEAELRKQGVGYISIEGRPKHFYSIYKKLTKVEGDIGKIYDLIAVRIVVPEITDCYKVMGLLHQQFKPLIYRIKDYIAVPKPNGYRSLHTTVFGLDGRITEIQIRTPQMHEEAERGLAAHFYYDQQKQAKDYLSGRSTHVPQKLKWVSELSRLKDDSREELAETLTGELFGGRIFVFSPKGDLYDLPEGSTPLDFAFAIHSDLGLRTQGAKVNGKIVPLDSQLENRDVVEVLARKQALPNRDWLNFVKTPVARNKIRAWFRAASRESNIESGQQVLQKELQHWGYKKLEEIEKSRWQQVIEHYRYKDLDGLLAAIGEGTISIAQLAKKLFIQEAPRPPEPARKEARAAKVEFASGGMPYNLAPCCLPAYPQPIVGYITRGSGVTIHTLSCHNLPEDTQRLIECYWEGTKPLGSYWVEVRAENKVGALRDVAQAISAAGVNIGRVESSDKVKEKETLMAFEVSVTSVAQLAALIRRIERLPAVGAVRRRS